MAEFEKDSKTMIRKIAPTLGLAFAIGIASPAWADGTPECNDGSSPSSVECGTGSTTGAGVFATAVGGSAQATGNQSTAIGATTQATGDLSVAVGTAATASGVGATALGNQSTATGVASVALGLGSNASADGSVALGDSSVADQANTVSVGSVGSERRVVNVAAGTLSATSTDAVNGSQLNATNQSVAAQGTAITALQTSDTAQTTQIAGLDTRVTALETIAGNLGALQGGVDTLFDLRRTDRRDMKQGVAAAMAMADAPMPSRPGGVSYQVKAGTFRGEHAISGALTYRLNTGSAMAVSAGVSYAGNKNNGATVAFSGEF